MNINSKEKQQTHDGLEIRNELRFKASPQTLRRLLLAILGSFGLSGALGLGLHFGGDHSDNGRFLTEQDTIDPECLSLQPVRGQSTADYLSEAAKCSVNKLQK